MRANPAVRLPPAASIALATFAALGACSPEPKPTDTAQTGVVADAGTAPAGPTPSPTASGGLTASVSGLKGSVSDLAIRVTDFGRVVDLPSDALFEYGKSDLTRAAEAQLRKAADLIRAEPVTDAIRIVGHTDSHGSDTDNLTLSLARADTVAAWLRSQPGLRGRIFEVSGKGESQPLAPNEAADGQDDPAARARNRRVELVLPSNS